MARAAEHGKTIHGAELLPAESVASMMDVKISWRSAGGAFFICHGDGILTDDRPIQRLEICGVKQRFEVACVVWCGYFLHERESLRGSAQNLKELLIAYGC